MEVEIIDVEKITPSPHQPRERFDKEELENLASSIAEHGLLQPVIIRPTGEETYQIIAGERRLRAVQIADIREIPAIVKDVDNAEQVAESLIENVHREDLWMPEKGRATHQLFLLNKIDMEPKELAIKIRRIRDKRERPERYETSALDAEEEKILNICEDQIHKPLRTIRSWLESVSVSKTILKIEAKKSLKDRIAGETLARISTIDKKTEQKEAYRKIRRDKMDQREASKFITWTKRQEPKAREQIYRSDVRVDVESPDMGFGEVTPVVIPKEEVKEARARVEKIREEMKEALAKPEVQRKGRLRRNWQALSSILNQLGDVFCPKCGLSRKGEPKSSWEKLKFECHDLNLRDAQETAREKYQEAVGGKKKE